MGTRPGKSTTLLQYLAASACSAATGSSFLLDVDHIP
jgi:hypothetical protein